MCCITYSTLVRLMIGICFAVNQYICLMSFHMDETRVLHSDRSTSQTFKENIYFMVIVTILQLSILLNNKQVAINKF